MYGMRVHYRGWTNEKWMKEKKLQGERERKIEMDSYWDECIGIQVPLTVKVVGRSDVGPSVHCRCCKLYVSRSHLYYLYILPFDTIFSPCDDSSNG